MKNAAVKSVRIHLNVSQISTAFARALRWIVTMLSHSVGITLQKTVEYMWSWVFIYYTRHNTERIFCTQSIHVTCCIRGCNNLSSGQKRLEPSLLNLFVLSKYKARFGLGSRYRKPRIPIASTIWKMSLTSVCVYIWCITSSTAIAAALHKRVIHAISLCRHYFA